MFEYVKVMSKLLSDTV